MFVDADADARRRCERDNGFHAGSLNRGETSVSADATRPPDKEGRDARSRLRRVQVGVPYSAPVTGSRSAAPSPSASDRSAGGPESLV